MRSDAFRNISLQQLEALVLLVQEELQPRRQADEPVPALLTKHQNMGLP